MWRKMLMQNFGSQNLTAFIQNLTFNFVSLKIARGRKILRAFVNPLNISKIERNIKISKTPLSLFRRPLRNSVSEDTKLPTVTLQPLSCTQTEAMDAYFKNDR